MNIRCPLAGAALVLLPHVVHAQVPLPRSFNPCDFDGDSKSDPAVIRNADGRMDWWVRLSTGGVLHFTWGIAGEGGPTLSCPDIDGDGKADPTIWRRPVAGGAGVFWSRLSAGGVRAQPWGQTGDMTWVLGDYDGDGRDDHAVYRGGVFSGEAGTYWILESSTGSMRAEVWGVTGDFPQSVPDYDGDGKTDLGVRRGPFIWRKLSSGGVDVINWGAPLEAARNADFDGDGRTDIAIFRYGSPFLQWWIRSSVTGAPMEPYGNGFIFGVQTTDVPVVADFDGDRRADVAVWRFDTGTWWILSAATGLTTVGWGVHGDFPVPWFYWY